jgi:hypothetical protein
MNGASIVAKTAEAAALSPSAALVLSVDSCARFLSIRDGRISSGSGSGLDSGLDSDLDFCGIEGLDWESGVGPVGVCGRLLGVVFGALGNIELESAFLSGSFGSKSESESLSLLSVDALASLLSESSEDSDGGFVIESKDSLFHGLCDLGREYLNLLAWVW